MCPFLLGAQRACLSFSRGVSPTVQGCGSSAPCLELLLLTLVPLPVLHFLRGLSLVGWWVFGPPWPFPALGSSLSSPSVARACVSAEPFSTPWRPGTVSQRDLGIGCAGLASDGRFLRGAFRVFAPAAPGHTSSRGRAAWVHALKARTLATVPMPVQAPTRPGGAGEKGPPVPHQGQGPQDRETLPCKPTGAEGPTPLFRVPATRPHAEAPVPVHG